MLPMPRFIRSNLREQRAAGLGRLRFCNQPTPRVLICSTSLEHAATAAWQPCALAAQAGTQVQLSACACRAPGAPTHSTVAVQSITMIGAEASHRRRSIVCEKKGHVAHMFMLTAQATRGGGGVMSSLGSSDLPYELFPQLAPPLVQADFRLRLLDEGDVGCIGRRVRSSALTQTLAPQAGGLIATWWQNPPARSMRFCGVLPSM